MKLLFALMVSLGVSSSTMSDETFQFSPHFWSNSFPEYGMFSQSAPKALQSTFRVGYYEEKKGDEWKKIPRAQGKHPDGNGLIITDDFVRTPDFKDWKIVRWVYIENWNTYFLHMVPYEDPQFSATLVINPVETDQDDEEWFVFRWRIGAHLEQRAHFGYRDILGSMLDNPKYRREYLDEKYLNPYLNQE